MALNGRRLSENSVQMMVAIYLMSNDGDPNVRSMSSFDRYHLMEMIKSMVKSRTRGEGTHLEVMESLPVNPLELRERPETKCFFDEAYKHEEPVAFPWSVTDLEAMLASVPKRMPRFGRGFMQTQLRPTIMGGFAGCAFGGGSWGQPMLGNGPQTANGVRGLQIFDLPDGKNRTARALGNCAANGFLQWGENERHQRVEDLGPESESQAAETQKRENAAGETRSPAEAAECMLKALQGRGTKRAREEPAKDKDKEKKNAKARPKMPGGANGSVEYLRGTISCKAGRNHWRVFIPAPVSLDKTRAWGAKISRADAFKNACQLLEEG